MFEGWFGKEEAKDLRASGGEKNGNGNYGTSVRNENLKRLLSPVHVVTNGNGKGVTAPGPPTFEQIYQNAVVKPPKLAYGVHKVAEMAGSGHLAGMPAEFKRRALLMALEAAGT